MPAAQLQAPLLLAQRRCFLIQSSAAPLRTHPRIRPALCAWPRRCHSDALSTSATSVLKDDATRPSTPGSAYALRCARLPLLHPPICCPPVSARLRVPPHPPVASRPRSHPRIHACGPVDAVLPFVLLPRSPVHQLYAVSISPADCRSAACSRLSYPADSIHSSADPGCMVTAAYDHSMRNVPQTAPSPPDLLALDAPLDPALAAEATHVVAALVLGTPRVMYLSCMMHSAATAARDLSVPSPRSFFPNPIICDLTRPICSYSGSSSLLATTGWLLLTPSPLDFPCCGCP
ncbi:hypothetical protein HYPSUDRAFT_72330 [Hypholoma sublateritium FD-334 SS-4]|uniref:Uncharacterized protein n=1 Tax=Hypholoma sublateritium (strain FD-334 SS-4) TaxID=945553 RepID=A0A0D2KJR2_HYPSF|nr:hypothetical protein HYPSUDRAFT_72330 [Hypholoma sublateritium FD-334 SS-4]